MNANEASSVYVQALITKKELAEWLRISERTIYRKVALGEIPKPLQIGRLMRWSRKSIEEFISSGGISPA